MTDEINDPVVPENNDTPDPVVNDEPEVPVTTLEEPPVEEAVPERPVIINGKTAFKLDITAATEEFKAPETWVLELIKRYFAAPIGTLLPPRSDVPDFKILVVEQADGVRGPPAVYNGYHSIIFTTRLKNADSAAIIADMKKWQPTLLNMLPWDKAVEPQ